MLITFITGLHPALCMAALLLGMCLDFLLGDPPVLPHPIRIIGAEISALETLLRKLFGPTERGMRAAGAVLVVVMLVTSLGIPALLLWLCAKLSVWLTFAVSVIMSYQIVATRALRDESMKVYRALRRGNIAAARHAVSMIVGRDTDSLDDTGVTKAAVETVAENASDGVIAPIIFMAIGGAPLGMMYKAANTMDSMVGYKNEKYVDFGRTAAKTDDALNFIPARVAGALMCVAAVFGFDAKNAWRVFRRDRKNHSSPNSAHTEAACAGALGIQLAGDAVYFGKVVEKPTMGDALRPVEAEDIPRANRLMYCAAGLAAVLFYILPAALALI